MTVVITIQSICQGLDFKIIAMTLKKVFKRGGISADGEVTIPEFNPQITQIDAD